MAAKGPARRKGRTISERKVERDPSQKGASKKEKVPTKIGKDIGEEKILARKEKKVASVDEGIEPS